MRCLWSREAFSSYSSAVDANRYSCVSCFDSSIRIFGAILASRYRHCRGTIAEETRIRAKISANTISEEREESDRSEKIRRDRIDEHNILRPCSLLNGAGPAASVQVGGNGWSFFCCQRRRPYKRHRRHEDGAPDSPDSVREQAQHGGNARTCSAAWRRTIQIGGRNEV